MPYKTRLALVDSNGDRLDPRLEDSLNDLLARFKRQFPALDDEATIAEVMEEAARRISSRERRRGIVAKLHAYAWVTVRSVGISYMRLASRRLIERTLHDEAAKRSLTTTQAATGSADEIERTILVSQLLALLTTEERQVTLWKAYGLSSYEIAVRLERTALSVDTIYCRAKSKMRKNLVQPMSRPRL